MNTIKLSYTASKENKDIILKIMKNQNNVIKFLYNRLVNNKDLTQINLTKLANSMNNIFIDSWFKQCAIYKAKDLKNNEKVIFGGKKLFFQRMNNKISKEEFTIQKLLPLYIIGESNKNGNRKFDFKIIENNKIIFKPHRSIKINLTLPKLRKNYQKILYKLQEKSEQKSLPITISLDLNFIYISYEESFLKQQQKEIKVKNRIMSIDMNPNFIGYSVIDWKNKDEKKIIKSGIISIKDLNDKEFCLKKDKISSEDKKMKYVHNKRTFEIYEIDKYLVNLAKVYKIECFAIEELNIESNDRLKGNKFNRLTNNMWCRDKFERNLEKRLNLSGIKLYKLYAQYSSFIGNILNREYPDCIVSSIEINRRCYCFKNKIKPVVFPNFIESINVITKSLEEFSNGQIKLIDKIKCWKDLYKQVKNLKLRYRVSLEDCKKSFKVFRLFDIKSYIDLYDFISI